MALTYEQARDAALLARPEWSSNDIDNLARGMVASSARSETEALLASKVAEISNEDGTTDWGKLGAANVDPEWGSPDSDDDFQAGLIEALEANLATAKQRGDDAEEAEKTIRDNLANGRIAPYRGGGRRG